MWKVRHLRVLLSVMILSLCTALSSLVCAETTGSEHKYRLEPLKGNLYRFVAGGYRAVVMVTDEGLFLSDPLSKDAALWLKRELKKRFPQPLRYLAFSHSHVDHLAGDPVYAGDVIRVAHQLAAEDIAATRLPVSSPDITFSDRLVLNLGDSSVHFRYYGANNGRGSVSMRFMPANVLHVVDWIVVGRMPYKDLPGYDIQGMIRSTREVLSEPDFDLFVGGHAATGGRLDVERYLAYLEDLYGAVRDGMLKGHSLEQLQRDIVLPEYKNLPMYEEWLPLNIQGVHRTLQNMSYFPLRTDIPGQ